MKLFIATETHFLRDGDGRIHSRTGIDAYPFWRRYLEVFDHVLVAARTGSGQPDIAAPVEGPGVTVAPLPDYLGPWEFLRCRRELADATSRALASADVLCLRAPGAIAGLAWRLWGDRPFGVEVVGDPAEGLAAGSVDSLLRPWARAILARDLRAMCRQATAVAYVTEHALQRRYPAGAWSTAYSSIDLDEEAFATEHEVLQRLTGPGRGAKGTPGHPWRLIFVGTLAQLYKGPDVLIDAFARCRSRGLEAALTMIGDGACQPSLEARALVRGLRDDVHFVGRLPAGAPIRHLLDRADVFVLPSRSEGLPRAMIEAMARGVPSLGCKVGGIPELLPIERLVPPGDVEALADAIMGFCSTATDFVTPAIRDLRVARRYHASVLVPRRVAFYRELRAARDVRVRSGARVVGLHAQR